MPKMKLPVNAVEIDPSVLPRIQDDDPVVAEYADTLRLDQKAMPPPVVFFDGKDNWLADGVKRLAALKRIGVEEPVCDVRKGTRSEAIFYASGANREHGVRLTNAEKKRAVENCLADKECAENTDGVIGELCGVSTSMVQKRRAALNKLLSGPGKPGKAGKRRRAKTGQVLETSAIGGKGGRKKKGAPKLGEPVFDKLDDEVPGWCRQVFVDRDRAC